MNSCLRSPKKLLVIFLTVIISTEPLHSQSGASNILSIDAFKNPPVSARPRALWPWTNGIVDREQITYELEEAKKKGMGGFDIWDIGTSIDPENKVPAGPAFLSDESVGSIAYAIKEANRLGLDLGLTFSSSWNAGGSWVKPKHAAMGLFRSDTIISNGTIQLDQIPFPIIPSSYGGRRIEIPTDAVTGLPVFYREVAIIAHRLTGDSVIDVNSIQVLSLKKNKQFNVPAGKWRIVRYICAPTGQPLAIPSPHSKGLMLDHFSASAQRANLDYIFSRLLPVTGNLAGSSLKYLYADSYEVNSAVWTDSLQEAFQKLNNYDLIKWLPVLDGFIIMNKDVTQRFLFDFRKTLSELIIRNHYQLGKDICNAHGIGFVAEAGGPGPPVHNVPFEDLKALGALTIPRGEFWNKHPDIEILQIIKGIASASHIYDQRFVEAESFTSVWLWQEGPDELKPLADRAMCEGLNRFIYHTFPHTPKSSGSPGWVYNFGTLINTTNGWWPFSNVFHEYLARCSYLLQQGNFVGDVAFYYGDRAPNFVPAKHIPASLGYGYDYDVVNTDAILNKFKVVNGKIVMPHGQSYEILVLPDERKMSPAVLRKLEQMIREGATVVGPKPKTSYGLAQAKANEIVIKNIAASVWGNCDSVNVQERIYGKGKIIWGKSLKEVLANKKILPDLTASNTAFDFIHRKTNDADIYFIRNSTKQLVSQFVSFRVDNRQPEYWNPETGNASQIQFKNADGRTQVYLSLDSTESCFIVFRNKAETSKPIPVIKDQNMPVWYHSDGRIFQLENTGAKILPGNWTLSFDQSVTGISTDTMANLQSLHLSEKPAIKYYSGIVSYQSNIPVSPGSKNDDQRIILDLGKVREIANVFINGKMAGSTWHAPFRIDITDQVVEGNNQIRIDVATTINNHLAGDSHLPPPYNGKIKTNIAKLPNAWRSPFNIAPLIEAGLIGPVQIKFAVAVK